IFSISEPKWKEVDRVYKQHTPSEYAEVMWEARRKQLQWMIKVVQDVKGCPDLPFFVSVRGGYFEPLVSDVVSNISSKYNEERQGEENSAKNINRLWGVLHVLGGAFETYVAGVLAVTPGMQLAAAYMAFRASDDLAAGLTTVATGRPTETFRGHLIEQGGAAL